MALFDLETLQNMVGEAAIQQAREAMDLESVSHFEFDKRGRIQAGVKPAPPSKETPSYVKITVRGKRQVVDCRSHGKGKWCLHALILAVYHVGVLPQYSVKKTAPKKPQTPKLGFRLEVENHNEGMVFSLRSLATGQRINRPLTYLRREKTLLGWKADTADVLAEVADEDGPSFEIPRQDLAQALLALKGTSLWSKDHETEFLWRSSGQPLPKILLSLNNQTLHWQAETPLPGNCTYVPGRPGFVIEGKEIIAQPYVGDLQMFGSGAQGRLSLTPQLLAGLLNEKHLFTWENRNLERLERLSQPGIKFTVDQGQLVGEAGFWHEERFIALQNWRDPLQWLPSQKRNILLQTHPAAMRRFGKEFSQIRAPWKDGRFVVREQMAPAFLKGFHIDAGLRVDREMVDRRFGVKRLSLEVHWDEEDFQPFYLIDGERFEHDELMAGNMGAEGVRLADGQLLNIDMGPIQTQARLIEGVAELHEDPSKRAQLLRRIRGEREDRVPSVSLNAYWQDLLRDYQLEGVQWLLNRWECDEPGLLADDMGLGKTIQTLAYLDTINTDQPQLVVVPRSLLANWKEESQRFCQHREVTIHHGSKRIKKAEDLQKKDLVLTTYGTVLRDLDLFYEVHFQMVVLDEAQAIKNPDAQTSQAIFDLWSDGHLALTGTPIENRLTELWSIFNFLAPGYLGDIEEIKQLPGPGTPAFEAFRQKAQPFLMRRLKKDVAKELPAKQELVLRVPLSQTQQRVYQDVLRGAQKDVSQGKPTTMSILTKLLRLRQICCHLGLVDETALQAASAKFEILLQHLEEVVASGHAALVFSQFTQLLGLLKFDLEERGWSYLYLDGQTKDRQALVHRFQKGEAPIFLMSLKAGGTGLNLTRASYVFHLDPWWNPMVMAQATDRAHRLGQTQTVTSYKIIAADTVEEHILKLQASKKLVAEGLWQDPDTLWENLDRETLLDLLR